MFVRREALLEEYRARLVLKETLVQTPHVTVLGKGPSARLLLMMLLGLSITWRLVRSPFGRLEKDTYRARRGLNEDARDVSY